MITGTHLLLYSADAEADRAFLRDVLGFRHVDVGQGWLIFGLPPAEVGVHPGDGTFVQQHAGKKMLGAVVYLMCDDVEGEVAHLAAKGVECTEIEVANWGLATSIPMPGGGSIGLYQPTHETAA